MILTLKILLAPLMIAAATLAGRRWGPGVSGWLIGFPFISAPISLVLAMQHGPEFAGRAAVGMLGGQASMCIFCVAYILAARRLAWWQSAPIAVGAFLVSIAVWNTSTLGVLPSFAILAALIVILILCIPPRPVQGGGQAPAWWDLPARMLTAAAFVAVLTGVSPHLGPQLSGLFSAFPVFGTVLAAFTHAQQGGHAAGQLLRGTILGSFGIASFYLVVGWFLPLTGSLWVYALAIAATLAANGISLLYTRPRRPA